MLGMSLDRFYFPLGEVVARLLQWGLPLALGVLVVGEGLAGALIYLSLHSIATVVVVVGQDKRILSRRLQEPRIVLLSVIGFGLLLIAVSALLFQSFLPSYLFTNNVSLSLFVASVFGAALQRVNVAILRSDDNGIGYLAYRVLINATRFSLYVSLLKWGAADVILLLLYADSIITALNVLIYVIITKRVDACTPLSENQMFGALIFGLPIMASVVLSSFSIHFARLYLSNVADAETVVSFSIAAIFGAAVTFVFSASAARGEPLVYAENSYERALSTADSLCRSMLLLGVFVSPVILGVSMIYGYVSGITISKGVFLVILLAHMQLPIWYKYSYLIVFQKQTLLIGCITAASIIVYIASAVTFSQFSGVYGVAVGQFMGNLTLILLGQRCVKSFD